VRSPPASSPLRVPIRPAPPRIHPLAVIVTVASGSRPEGPDGSGVNGWTLGPLRLLGRLSPAGQGLPWVTRASLSLHSQPPFSMSPLARIADKESASTASSEFI
jgi:hypothetical protein